MKLFILGNGFDISHQIPCRYSDFYSYLLENRNDILEVMEKFYYVESDSDLWSDFETSLEEDIIYDSLKEIIGENSPNCGSDDFSDGDWYTAQVYVEDECEELLVNIRNGFEEWINSLDISDINRIYKLDKSDFYITFNYTEILERIYNIPLLKIMHIHNKVGEELIFGHGKNSENFNVRQALYGDENAFLTIDEDGNVESGEMGHEKFAENAVDSFYDMMRKPTEKIIENNFEYFNNLRDIDEIVVIGHSYNEIDFPYFKRISEQIGDSVNWTLCYYSDNDLQSAKEIMRQLGISTDLQSYKHSTELEIKDNQLNLF
ncbi:hypothetical protein IX39_17005 [Chryseobacterium formosense]|uniref:Bacteriophage abortive infection AbiH n=1 Tax=Chryseobacterium formosense TaxID=236814 RepID=A0A085Z0Y0_9FLAO|nr:bacteriophage abortive infection AbiH family protein [Chryseobacterium formosense]KFE98093.1 hypothetical protein IX39_17005 [Chryseobacterium formosense]SFT72969.1 Bacteriophage abortive infection AbiH [Chryseobacterium formosense]